MNKLGISLEAMKNWNKRLLRTKSDSSCFRSVFSAGVPFVALLALVVVVLVIGGSSDASIIAARPHLDDNDYGGAGVADIKANIAWRHNLAKVIFDADTQTLQLIVKDHGKRLKEVAAAAAQDVLSNSVNSNRSAVGQLYDGFHVTKSPYLCDKNVVDSAYDKVSSNSDDNVDKRNVTIFYVDGANGWVKVGGGDDDDDDHDNVQVSIEPAKLASIVHDEAEIPVLYLCATKSLSQARYEKLLDDPKSADWLSANGIELTSKQEMDDSRQYAMHQHLGPRSRLHVQKKR